MNDSGPAGLSAGTISARLDRPPATRSIWTMVALLGFGLFFELYVLMFRAMSHRASSVGCSHRDDHGLFGTSGVSSFIAAFFAGLFIGTASRAGFLPIVLAAARSSRGRCSGIRRPTSWWRSRMTPPASISASDLRGLALASRS